MGSEMCIRDRRQAAQARYTQPLDSDQLAHTLKPKFRAHQHATAAAMRNAASSFGIDDPTVGDDPSNMSYIHPDRRDRFGLTMPGRGIQYNTTGNNMLLAS